MKRDLKYLRSLFHLLLVNMTFYYTNSSGNTNYPYDEISGYSMGDLEDDVVKYSYGLHSLKSKLKANKPTVVTDKEIDLYLSYY